MTADQKKAAVIRVREWRAQNPSKAKALAHRVYMARREHYKARARVLYIKRRKEILEQQRKRYANDAQFRFRRKVAASKRRTKIYSDPALKARYAKMRRRQEARRRKLLYDSYVAHVLALRGWSRGELSDALVKTMRAGLMLKREIRKWQSKT